MPIRIISAVFEHQEPTKPFAYNRVTINLAVDDMETDAAVMERLDLIRDSVNGVLLPPQADHLPYYEDPPITTFPRPRPKF